MNGPLAQIVALTGHANAAARGDVPSFFAGNSTCKFCDRVSFDGAKRGWFWFSSGPPSAGLGFDGADQAEYERVSERTFQAIHSAIVAAVNGFASRRAA